ncbi:zf-HC2 domain-containing protein [Duganella callida]|uniref:Uncharacterized protein n=1 Tax=Duganella callida TaxID=2561932 RepID=A0A4Y9SY83_9BURK|nr:zf-HC2 domain-containing protein [Duganella callida]TFW31399.1 hypothetical protein E4L98_00465 [Duganella callida]
MNGRIFRMDVPVHQAVQELLPWYASGQLAPDETARVQEHLQGCAQCRRELDWERATRAQAAADPALPPGVDMERALAQLLPALGPSADDAAARPARVRWWRAAAANQPSWLRWAMAAQWVAIVGLAALLMKPSEEPAYRVLGSGAAMAGNLVVVFQPNTSERELRRILQAQNARVVDGPTVTDAYLLTVPADNRDHALQALRAESAVKLVEPLDGGSAP